MQIFLYSLKVYVLMVASAGNSLTLAHTCYFVILDRTWGWVWFPPPPPARLPLNRNKASQQRRTESLGHSESNHIRFYYLRWHFDPTRAGKPKILFFARLTFLAKKKTFERREIDKNGNTVAFLASRRLETYAFYSERLIWKCDLRSHFP